MYSVEVQWRDHQAHGLLVSTYTVYEVYANRGSTVTLLTSVSKCIPLQL